MAQMLTIHQITRRLGPGVPAWDVHIPVQRLSHQGCPVGKGVGGQPPWAGQHHVVLISQARLFAHTWATARLSGLSNFPDLNSTVG